MGKHDGLTVKLWSSTQSVQAGLWKRFNELQPKPNLMKSGCPRLAQYWDKLKQKVESVSLVLIFEDFNAIRK